MKKILVSFLTFFLLFLVLLSVPKSTFAHCQIESLTNLRQQIIDQIKETLSKITPTPFHLPTLPQEKEKPVLPIPTQPLPTPTPSTAPSSDEVKNYIMGRINDYRKSKGLYPVQTNGNTCNFAKIRAQEISQYFSHDGFMNKVNSGTLPYPSYSIVTENIAMTHDYKDVVNMWINSPSHAANMEQDTPYVCVEKYGNFYAYEGWKP